MQLKIDAEKMNDFDRWDGLTGYYVRALSPSGKWLSVDCILLERSSLLFWLSKYDRVARKPVEEALRNFRAL